MTPDLRIQQAVVLADARGVRGRRADRTSSTRRKPSGSRCCSAAAGGCRVPARALRLPVRQEARRGRARRGPAGLERATRLPLPRARPRTLPAPRRPVRDLRPLSRPTGTLSGTLPSGVADGTAPRAHARTTRRDPQARRHAASLGATQALVDGNRVLLLARGPTRRSSAGCGNSSRTARVRPLAGVVRVLRRTRVAPRDSARRADPSDTGRRADRRGGPRLPAEQLRVEPADRDRIGRPRGLRRLLARRTADDTIRLGLYILGFALVVAVVFRFVL